MIGDKTISIIYLLGIIYALYTILSSVNQKKRLGDIVLDIDNVRVNARAVVVGVLTILVGYMIYLSVRGYTSVETSNTIMLINLILEVLFWVAIYAIFLYAQFAKRYIGKEGLSIGTKGYTWEEIKKYSWKDNQLAITVEEKFFSKTKEKGLVLNIPMNKIEDASDILRVNIKGKSNMF